MEDNTPASNLSAIKDRLEHKLRVANVSTLLFGLATATLVTGIALDAAPQHGVNLRAMAGAALLALLGTLVARQLVKHSAKSLRKFEDEIFEAMDAVTSEDLKERVYSLRNKAQGHTMLLAALSAYNSGLKRHLLTLLDKEVHKQRVNRIAQLCAEADQLVTDSIKRKHESRPYVRAKLELEKAIPRLKHLVAEADRQFEEELDKKVLTWWRRMTRDRSALEKIEIEIEALEVALERVSSSPDLLAAEEDYEELKQIVGERLAAAKSLALEAIPECHQKSFEPDHALSVGLVSAALGIPVSVALDLNEAGGVYDALRDVNANYAEMSDLEIWQETLAMSPEALAGLASLTKGSYFETLVESDLGGERFAHFNHPDTDIVIDGVAYQIKATDSAAYIESVADHIPVIATTEVAETTGVIDGGYTNADLSDVVDVALGGSLIDFGDTFLDGITTGVGGVGIVAILQGANGAWSEYKKSGDAIDALGVGIQTTAMGVARSAVNLTEIVVRGSIGLATSAPARFAGRLITGGSADERNEAAKSPQPSAPRASESPLERPRKAPPTATQAKSILRRRRTT
ncbi:hypothetical protein KUV75_04055 [Qipengyuania gaetbuli]|uniref:hypothetical protein n=1 Tax=Qipengyuania gaetbuli TaxID=266952 RepID=UPI001C99112C|nr:hypothetical protein [Qipengyuania gaetbuli]MBY6014074.1 hypothetical protein [Qipengyuania gaetbuli]